MFSAWVDRRLKWILVMPAVLFVLALMAFPVIYTLRLSMFDWNLSMGGSPAWIGLKNYSNLLVDARFWESVGHTFYYTFFALAVETLLGIAIALLFFRKFKGSNVSKTILLLPMVATPVAIGLVWMLIYEPTIGIANAMLKSFGLTPLVWLGSKATVIPSLVLIDVWQFTPMVAIICIAGIATIPTDPYESASIDGASKWQQTLYITLPLLRPTILIAVVLRLIELLKQFDTIFATTQGGPGTASETMNIFSYRLAFEYFQMGQASASLMLFLVIIMIFTAGFILLRKYTGVGT